MNAVKSMLLDIRAAKSQFKNGWVLLMFPPLLIFIGMTAKLATAVLIFLYAMVLMLPVITPSLAFSTYDNFSSMYLSFPQKKSNIVSGRYLLSLMGGAISLLFCTIVTFIAGIFGYSTSGIAAAICALAFVFSLLPSIQMPVFFRFGYVKSRFFMYVSIFSIMIVPWLISLRFSNDQMDAFMNGKVTIPNEPLLCIAFLLAALFCLAISYFISLALFSKKDI
jgi:ABC-2 type transport system permease protein